MTVGDNLPRLVRSEIAFCSVLCDKIPESQNPTLFVGFACVVGRFHRSPPHTLGTQRLDRESRHPHAPQQYTAGKMTSLPNRALAAVAVFALTATNVVQQTEAHPNCIGDFAPDLSGDSGFCPNEYDDGFCCSGAQEVGIEVDYDAAVAAGATGRCAEMYQEV